MPKPKSKTHPKPIQKFSSRGERLLVGYTGNVQFVYNESTIIPIAKFLTTISDINHKKQETPSHTLLFPCISTVERAPRLCGKGDLSLYTTLDFDLYPCSGCRIETNEGIGNTIFLTNTFGITTLNLVPHSKDKVTFNLPLENLNSPNDGLGFSLAPFARDNLTLVRLPNGIGLRSAMVPEIPPQCENLSSNNPKNCIVFSYVPPCVDSEQVDKMAVIKWNDSLSEMELNNEVVEALSDEVRYYVKNFMAHHNNMIASFGFTKEEWLFEELPGIQGHTCSTLYGYSGSAVRLIEEDTVNIVSSTLRPPFINLQFTNNPAIPIFHGIHLQTSETTQGSIALNQFIRTDSLSFIYLYCIAISKSYLELDVTVFPTIEHAKTALNYLKHTKSRLGDMKEPSQAVNMVSEAVLAALKTTKNSMSVFENQNK